MARVARYGPTVGTERRRSSTRWERQAATSFGDAGIVSAARSWAHFSKLFQSDRYMLLVLSETLLSRNWPTLWMSVGARPSATVGRFLGERFTNYRQERVLLRHSRTPQSDLVLSSCFSSVFTEIYVTQCWRKKGGEVHSF